MDIFDDSFVRMHLTTIFFSNSSMDSGEFFDAFDSCIPFVFTNCQAKIRFLYTVYFHDFFFANFGILEFFIFFIFLNHNMGEVGFEIFSIEDFEELN